MTPYQARVILSMLAGLDLWCLLLAIACEVLKLNNRRESQFLATRKFRREEIVGIWRVPPYKVRDISGLSNSNHEVAR